MENLAFVSCLPKGSISRRQFFFREDLPEGCHNLHYAYAPIEKVRPIFRSGTGDQVTSFASSFVKTEDGLYRFYATSFQPDCSYMRICVWESPDCLTWEPRNLNQVNLAGKDTNIIRFEGIPGNQDFVCQPQVVPLPDGRWRMYFWKHRGGHVRYTIAESEDGLKWQVPDFDKPALYHPADGGLWALAEGLVLHKTGEAKLSVREVLARKSRWSNDATFVYYNDRMERYECYTVWLHPAVPDRRVEVDNAPGVHRLIQRRLSEDGLEWSAPELLIMPDRNDPWDLQFYYLSVQWHENFLIGSLGYYRVEDGQQTMDMDLCFSPDGCRWERPLRGGFIPRSGESQKRDSMGIYAPNAWLDLGNRWLCLYTGVPDAHNASKSHSFTLGATFAKNRFIGLAAGRVTGGFLTEPFFLTQPEVKLDAHIRGWLRAELCDAFGRKLPGFHLMDSAVVKGNKEAQILKWKKFTTADHRYECLRLRFEYADGEIYNIGF